MKGKVQGLPTTVPATAAIIWPRSSHASSMPSTICRPMKGVNEMAAPHAKPQAILCGVPGSRTSRFQKIHAKALPPHSWPQPAFEAVPWGELFSTTKHSALCYRLYFLNFNDQTVKLLLERKKVGHEGFITRGGSPIGALEADPPL